MLYMYRIFSLKMPTNKHTWTYMKMITWLKNKTTACFWDEKEQKYLQHSENFGEISEYYIRICFKSFSLYHLYQYPIEQLNNFKDIMWFSFPPLGVILKLLGRSFFTRGKRVNWCCKNMTNSVGQKNDGHYTWALSLQRHTHPFSV